MKQRVTKFSGLIVGRRYYVKPKGYEKERDIPNTKIVEVGSWTNDVKNHELYGQTIINLGGFCSSLSGDDIINFDVVGPLPEDLGINWSEYEQEN
jgi:hypothetical protein